MRRSSLLGAVELLFQLGATDSRLFPAYSDELPKLVAGAEFLTAQLVDPLGCSSFEFGMILVFPRTRGGFQRLELAQPHELVFGRLSEETAALAAADHRVNV